MQFNFEWDPKKAIQNFQKHKVSFERASQVFKDPLAISIYDEEHSITEDRWITLGKEDTNVLMVVIHTFKEITDTEYSIRIISARKATTREKNKYEG